MNPYVRFPGIEQVVGCTYGMAHGISPGIARLVTKPQAHFTPEIGDLIMGFGNNLPIILRQCKVLNFQLDAPAGGAKTWTLTLADRRWKWEFAGPRGPLKGHYNVRLANGELEARTEKTPQTLAKICLEAMGEENFDVADMPNDSRPLVEWEHEIPAEALQDLCESLGCRIILQLDNSIAIRRLGIGRDLFVGPTTVEASGVVDPPERPDSIMCVGEKVRYQIWCQLEAVGLEYGTDAELNRLKLIDDLSYKPTDTGWGSIEQTFASVEKGVRFSEKRRLAERCVYRWYRLKIANRDGSTPLRVSGYPYDEGYVRLLKQITPIEDVDCHVTRNTDGSFVTHYPLIQGIFYDKIALNAQLFDNTPDGTRYIKAFRINRELGLIEFSEQVYKLVDPDLATKTREPAEMTVRIAASIRDYDKWNWDRVTIERESDLPKRGTGPRIIRRDELVLSVWDYTQGLNGAPGKPEDNYFDVKQQMDFYINEAEQEYKTTNPEMVVESGIVPVDCDGAIQQVMYTIQGRYATTQISRNNEFSPVRRTYEERRFLERLRDKRFEEAKKQSARERARKKRHGEQPGLFG